MLTLFWSRFLFAQGSQVPCASLLNNGEAGVRREQESGYETIPLE